MIKICHILDELSVGGLEKNVVLIATGLDKKDFYQEIWCLKKLGVLAQDVKKLGIPVREFGLSGGLNIIQVIKLGRELKKGNFSIVHSYDLV